MGKPRRVGMRQGAAEREGPPPSGIVSSSLGQRAAQIHARLAQAIPAPRLELDFRNPWELLVATILAAQSTDRTINLVTPALFQSYPTPAALGAAPQDEVERLVHETGFFRNKARAIREASRKIAEEFGGEVPRTLEALIALPGVARKTANVVLAHAYRIAEGIAVDRHTARVSRRLGLTEEEDPTAIEADLCQSFPTNEWIDVGLRLQLHGRYVCTARAPDCRHCPLNELCPSKRAAPEGTVDERASLEAARIAAQGEPETP
ncbi:endonuclease III [Polyangium sp. 15x6]|uniref:endonuclease III n=1 Tax=Polyangium sp. 15x6 TaxID=3042687 RepID=UPI00249B770C|nr:endonuclease III [Polyangium sp. 15x6]MDI3291413.1 endonuclease III [Polyangium sp. 15x6]